MGVAEYRIEPQEGPQYQAVCSPADILIYGGQAGGGKTWLLVADPLKYDKHEGWPEFRGVIFRRTYPQITGQGGIWDEANKLYRRMGAHMREGDKLDAEFPSGTKIAFSHLQHEKTKYEYQGHQICYIGFDELTHFTEGQFFYMLSRNRSTCGIKPYIKATCNPDATSWVAEFIQWWIDPETGLAIQERSGVLRYMFRDVDDTIYWADTKEDLIERFEQATDETILSVTFIPATLDDNPELTKNDPTYVAKLHALPRIERERLLGGNWKIAEGAIIESEWLNRYVTTQDLFRFNLNGHTFEIPMSAARRIATIDTAGTGKERAAQKRGDPPSFSCCLIWDSVLSFTKILNGRKIVLTELLFLRYAWRDQAEWHELKSAVPEVLQTWNVQVAYLENAHYGKPLKQEIKCCRTELVGPMLPGMDTGTRDAKLERAVASGMLTRMELGKILIPADSSPWLMAYIREITTWTGLPKETSDQIDATSYASYVSKGQTSGWGGVLKQEAV